MSLLSAFLTGVDNWLSRQVFLAINLVNQTTAIHHRINTQVSGICAHVGDKPGFVKALGQCHGFFHRKPKSRARRLL